MFLLIVHISLRLVLREKIFFKQGTASKNTGKLRKEKKRVVLNGVLRSVCYALGHKLFKKLKD